MNDLFAKAEAYWQMNNLFGGENCPFELVSEGRIEFIELDGEDRDASLKRGGNGRALKLYDADLKLHAFQSVRYRPKNNCVSLYARVYLEENTSGCFFYSDFLAFNINRSKLICAYVGVKTKSGANYREMPLCYEHTTGWKDFIITINERKISIYINGALCGKYDLPEDLAQGFMDDIVIGGFKCLKPDTYSNGLPFAKFSEITYETVALWHCPLSEKEIAFLSDVEKITWADINSTNMEILKNYNAFYDASIEKDLVKCQNLWNLLKNATISDPIRPKYHLTQPFGFIFDPCGAFYHNGKYHVYSYHNIEYLLNYSSLDHYESEDLVNWHQVPIGPWADNENDLFCIYLMNHFYDDKGDLRTLYTGQGFGGKRGILAKVSDDMMDYTEKHSVLTKYHHDGHVFKHDGKWYTITSKLCRDTRPGDKGDPVMMWSSEDLENWKEEGEIFYQKKTPENPAGFMEFPYLLNYGDKDVLILGGRPVRYWVGHFDWKRLKFYADTEEGKLFDNTNPFHCFNPLAVDKKGENGAERRIVMALFSFVGSGDREIQWGCCHTQPRVLTFEGDHLMQDPTPEIETLRVKKAEKPENLGACFEFNGTFDISSCEKQKIIFKDGENDMFAVDYNPEDDTYSVYGGVNYSGTFAAYQNYGERAGKPVNIRVFVDRTLVEVFVNGQPATTSLCRYANNMKIEFSDETKCIDAQTYLY